MRRNENVGSIKYVPQWFMQNKKTISDTDAKMFNIRIKISIEEKNKHAHYKKKDEVSLFQSFFFFSLVFNFKASGLHLLVITFLSEELKQGECCGFTRQEGSLHMMLN